MSRTRHADNSWRAWGEYRKERSRLKDFIEWKSEALEELEMSDTESVYVILNEWDDIADEGSIEIVGGMYFSTEASAWDHLDEIADAYGIELLLEDTSFDVPSPKGLKYETYYIMELNRYGISS